MDDYLSAGVRSHGKGILRLAITGVAARRINVAVNGKPAGVVEGLVCNAIINRDGIQGMGWKRTSSLMRQ